MNHLYKLDPNLHSQNKIKKMLHKIIRCKFLFIRKIIINDKKIIFFCKKSTLLGTLNSNTSDSAQKHCHEMSLQYQISNYTFFVEQKREKTIVN
jgi:hypothetical protein